MHIDEQRHTERGGEWTFHRQGIFILQTKNLTSRESVRRKNSGQKTTHKNTFLNKKNRMEILKFYLDY